MIIGVKYSQFHIYTINSTVSLIIPYYHILINRVTVLGENFTSYRKF